MDNKDDNDGFADDGDDDDDDNGHALNLEWKLIGLQ
jgi:hypothetical protein